MNEKGPWALGLMAIAIAALVGRGVLPQDAGGLMGSPAEPKKTEKEASGPERKEAPWTEFCPAPCLYQEFFGIPLSAETESWPDTAGKIVEGANRQGYNLEFLFALVPDPVDSHLSNRFDEALDALQRGIAQSGYLFDRASLPWVGKAAQNRLYRSIPGSLLFRTVDMQGQRHLLTVFLVGESPKGGIQKQTFYTALDFMSGLQQETPPSVPLRILGPSFSGSAESLQIALREWLSRRGPDPGGLEIEMVTGSATARGLETSFQKLDGAGIKVDFARTIVDDDTLQVNAYKLLRERLGWNLAEVALITEFDTKYGESFQSSSLSPMVVQFPSNLAYIRTAREKLGLDRDPGSSETTGTARKSLDLSLADHDEPVDVVPQLNELSTQVNDMALASLLHGICQKHYIGILATDIQDRLFLAEQVHSFCPDAVVFTFDNHLLDAHPQVSKSMDGTLVLTSYPLYRSNEKETLRQFTSEFQQGIYLAARQLLGNQQPAPSAVWLTAVGNGELWPIAVQSAALPFEPQRPLEIPAIREGDRAGVKWLLAALAIAGLAVWIGRLAQPLQKAATQSWDEKVPTYGAVLIPALGAGVLWVASAVLLVFYGLPLWDRAIPCPWQGASWYTNLAVLILIYLGMSFVFARLVWPPRRWFGAFLWIAVCVLVPVLLGRTMLEFWLFPEGSKFFYARAGSFSSGLSPLVSLALLGLAAYSWSVLEIKRRRLIVAEDLPWPLRSSPDPALAACGRSAERVRDVLLERPRTAFWGILGLVLLLPAMRLFRRVQPIAETRGYGVFFLLVVMFVFVLAAISFYRFFVAWRRLERTLARLCNTWMLPVLSRASRLLDWQPLKSFGLRMPPIKMTLVSAQQLRTLARLGLLGPDGVALAGGAGEPRGALDDHLDSVFEAEDEGEVLAEIAARRDLRRWFDRDARFLDWLRWTSGSAEPMPNDEEGKSVPRPREVEMREIETYLAVRVVAYLRYIFAHLRYALVSATICGLTLLVAVSSYAFQPKRFLSFAIWMALLLASVMTMRAFVQMDRNGALSAISGTDAGKVSLDRTFFSNIFTYGGIPVLGVVLTQFPAVGHVFGGWLGPLLRVVGGG
ncbi:MAG TPA: hypothetical protein VF179_30655 [Thermoanaerobaculia bacterium]|nr:hypothetical protein [Thermoanaerobaculia bacterium]